MTGYRGPTPRPPTSPIQVTEDTTITFMARDAAGNQNEIVSEIYIIGPSANVPPEADAGEDITISLGEEALLDGSASNDPDDGPGSLTCSWEFLTLPPGCTLTNADISGANTLYPSFVPDAPGTYMLELAVSDGEAYDYDDVSVIVEPEAPTPGDLDGDVDVDRDDLNIILGHRNQPATVCPECDLDGDGMITALDARKLVLLCTRPRCACE